MLTRSRVEIASVGVLALAVCYMVLAAVLTLLYASVRTTAPGYPGTFTPRNFVQVYTNPETFRLLPLTVGYAAGTSLLAAILGTFFAWTVSRSTIP